MATLQASGLADLLTTTLDELGEGKFTEITTDLQEFVAMSVLLKKNRVKVEAGPNIEWRVMVTHSGSARATGLYGRDQPTTGEVMVEATMPWRHYTTDYSFDRRELKMNRSPRKIVDLLLTKRIDQQIAMAALMEERFWALPAFGTNLHAHGVPYWIVKSATSTGDKNGTHPSGYSDVAGISSTTYDRWTNWARPYTEVSADDLLVTWSEACYKTNWKTPVDGIPTFSTGDQRAFYTNYPVYAPLERLLRQQNDDLGTDLDKYAGQVIFHRTPVKVVPQLLADTTNPVYGIQWGDYKTYILADEWGHVTKVDVTPGQHTVASVFMDYSFNWVCKNRRTQFVISNGTTLP
jgi:hypothetical protein